MQTTIAGKAIAAESTILCITERSRSISDIFLRRCFNKSVALLSAVPQRLWDSICSFFISSSAAPLVNGAPILATALVRSRLVTAQLCGHNGQSENLLGQPRPSESFG
jgi:hypothetical protein